MSAHGDDDLIIERPDLQSWPRLLGSRVVTAAMWALYIYLWLPLLTLLAWSAGLRVAYQQMVEYGGYQIAFDLWLTFALVILALGAALLIWARINLHRFRGQDRRSGTGPTDRARLADDFALSLDQLGQLERSRRVHIGHHPNGDITRMEIVTTGSTAPRPPAPQTADFQ